ncbi:MAG: hypothetical protein HZA89_00495 [Verrucomicrobia bacterium]|nr:hypothetical protein [Verrucomicrobiota bacterium]
MLKHIVRLASLTLSLAVATTFAAEKSAPKGKAPPAAKGAGKGKAAAKAGEKGKPGAAKEGEKEDLFGAKAKSTKWDAMDTGPFFSGGLEVPLSGTNEMLRPALKGVSIKLGVANEAAVCFDTERCRMAIGWTGGFLNLPKKREGLEGVAQPVGQIKFSSTALPGWASPKNSFLEPQPPKKDGKELISFGPLPKDWAKWKGLYVHGSRVILSYSVGKANVLEMPAYDSARLVFVRHFEVDSAHAPMTMLVCEEPKARAMVEDDLVVLDKGDGYCTAIGLSGPVFGKFGVTSLGRVLLTLGTAKGWAAFKVSIWSGPKADVAKFRDAVKRDVTFADLKAMTAGGAAQWGPAIAAKGTLGKGDGAYVVDTLPLPENNQWKSWIRPGGFDFFKDGQTAALCSVNGEVWIVSGIDDTLENVKWRRFATGLFQPLGLKIVKEKIYVLGRDQITRLHDLNGDGEADFYENFNNDVAITSHYHEFALDLNTDTAGNFYFAKGSQLSQAKHQHQGAFLRVSADGSRLDVVATGLRAPNGSSVGPRNEMTVSDNEGNWTPTSRVNLIKKGGFYGHVFTSHRSVPPLTYDPPLFWLPHQEDNSSGGQVWVTSDQWGPFKGDMLHLSYGKCSLFKVTMDKSGGVVQGGAVRFPLNFDSGVMRGRFNPADGQLYLCGLRVWQSSGAREGTFQRVRYTGKPVTMPREMRVKKNGIELTFTSPLDPKTATDLENYSVDEWNYHWTKEYGSKLYSVSEPGKELGEKKQTKYSGDDLEIKSVTLGKDRKTVFIELPELKPAMQFRVKYNLDTADGALLRQEIFGTINSKPKAGR